MNDTKYSTKYSINTMNQIERELIIMGIIKKECAICSKPIIKLLSNKFDDGFYVCDDCLKEASSSFKSNHLTSLTVANIKKYLSQKKTEKEFVSTQFEKTKTFSTATGDVIYIDEKKGLWIKASDSNPDIIHIDQVIDCFSYDKTPRVVRDPFYDTPRDDPAIYTSIVFKLNHEYLSHIEILITNTQSPTFVQDNIVGKDIIKFFKRNLSV